MVSIYVVVVGEMLLVLVLCFYGDVELYWLIVVVSGIVDFDVVNVG